MVRRLVDRIVRVPEPVLRSAVAASCATSGLVAEGAGAAGVAALLCGGLKWRGRVAVVLSGANIDPDVLAELLGS